jgi:LysM repeat protein
LAALILVAMAIVIALVVLYTGDKIWPGVQTLGVEVGGKSRVEAVALLQRNWGARTVVLSAGDTTWQVTPTMLGIMLDADATVELAHQQGRSLPTLKQALRAENGVQIPPAFSFDPSIAQANLLALKPKFDIPPVSASLHVVDGRVEAIPSSAGRALDVAATAIWLEWNTTQVIDEGRLDLVMTSVQPSNDDLSAVLPQANQLLATPLSIRAYDPITDQRQVWEATPVIVGDWLSLGIDPDDPSQLDWALHSEKVQAFLSAQAATFGPARYLDWSTAIAAIEKTIEAQGGEVRVRVYHHQTQHVVQAGQTLASIAREYGMPYPWLQDANPGVGDTLSVGQVLTIPSPDKLLPLPVVENKRVVVSLSQQRMWAYENGTLKWEWPVSTGIPSSPTSPGVFQVQTHEPNAYASNWDLWMPNFMGIYRPVPTSDFMNGFHGFPTRGGSTLLWTDDLGHPVTYGCILVSSTNATALYEWAEAGMVVEVQP